MVAPRETEQLARERRVVFNADDLGMGPGVELAILRAARAGIVREVSVSVTRAVPREALAELVDLGVGIGLHFNLTDGVALGGPLRGLTDATGRFRGLPAALVATTARVMSAAQTARELALQLEALADWAPLSHVNGHHHVHVFPGLCDVVLRGARRAGIHHVRSLSQPRWVLPDRSPRGLLLRGLGARFERRLLGEGFEVRPLVGLALTGQSEYRLRFWQQAQSVAPGRYEWLVHPVHAGGGPALAFGARLGSDEELAVLEAPETRERLAALDIRPCRFHELGP